MVDQCRSNNLELKTPAKIGCSNKEIKMSLKYGSIRRLPLMKKHGEYISTIGNNNTIVRTRLF